MFFYFKLIFSYFIYQVNRKGDKSNTIERKEFVLWGHNLQFVCHRPIYCDNFSMAKDKVEEVLEPEEVN